MSLGARSDWHRRSLIVFLWALLCLLSSFLRCVPCEVLYGAFRRISGKFLFRIELQKAIHRGVCLQTIER